MNVIYIVGIGPGSMEMMTGQAMRVLEESDVIIGYSVYLELLRECFGEREMLSTPMRQEVERCRMAYEKAMQGRRVAVVCSGDAGIYGLVSLMYELLPEYQGVRLSVIPGITAASSGAACLGAPIGNDFCVISLSDQLTPWEQIEKRLRAAVSADFCIVLYNPASRKRTEHLKRACDILLETAEGERPCGYVENIGRSGTEIVVCPLRELREAPVNMFTTVFIGNSQSVVIDGRLVTKRGYRI
ncbi:MAG: precorrin-3B C(17)-methyltransferase [Butyrivibrio sp.]|nr:precorrin-3B C(17)-methyltransferase [Butyrivibrio sp.]